MCIDDDSLTLFLIQIRDELDYLPVLVSLPPQQTIFEYLVGCWKRLNAVRSTVVKKVTDFREAKDGIV